MASKRKAPPFVKAAKPAAEPPKAGKPRSGFGKKVATKRAQPAAPGKTEQSRREQRLQGKPV